MQEHFTTSIDENNIVHMTIGGTIKNDMVPALKEWIKKTEEVIKETYQKTGAKVKSLVDLTALTSEYDAEGISIFASFTKDNEPYIYKTATFGANWTIKFAQNIVTSLSGRSNIKAFTTKEDAIAWLNE